MSFISLTAKLHKKTETKKLKYFPASYAGRFYSNLANNTDNEASSDFYGRIANDVNISFEDVQRFLLASNDFAKGMQDDINLYVTRDVLSKASFRQKLDPISKNIFRRWNPLELVLKDISTFDAQNPVVESLLRDINVEKNDVASNLIKKAPRPSIGGDLQKRLNALRNNKTNFNNSSPTGLSPPPPRPPFRNFIPRLQPPLHLYRHLIHFLPHFRSLLIYFLSHLRHHLIHFNHNFYYHLHVYNKIINDYPQTLVKWQQQKQGYQNKSRYKEHWHGYLRNIRAS